VTGVLAWHFVNASRTLQYDAESLAVEPGYIYSIADHETPALCECGMHGSRRAIDALQFAPGPVICRVRIFGDVREDKDKLVGRHREVLWMADATEALHRMSVWAVRNTPLPDGRKVWDLLTDERSRRAVEVKELWIDGKATDVELDAARDAAGARDAARDAARAAAWAAARDAAWAAAWDSAWAAARAAAWAAAWDSAWDAAADAAWDAQSLELERLLSALEPAMAVSA
jgi:hypothetical protein